MGRTYEGHLAGDGLRFGIVLSRFNDFIGSHLLAGAQDILRRHGVREEDIDVVRVPGSWEIPLAAQKLAATRRYDALICLGVLIRGSTPHFDYIASEASKGIASVSLQTGIPISFGVITAENIEQAIERAGTKMGNKGHDAALAALEMANLMRQLEE
jgi:6,7-dimethyl-8-ribityllumazine synthase